MSASESNKTKPTVIEAHIAQQYFFSEKNFLFHVRRFFDPDSLRALRESIKQKSLSLSETDRQSETFREYGVAPNSLRLNEQWYCIWGLTQAQWLKQWLAAFNLILYPPQIRTVKSSKGIVAWHQDNAYMKAMGSRAHRKVITCFLSLEENLQRRPNLEFFINPKQQAVDHIIKKDAKINIFDLPNASQPSSEQCQVFDVSLGDALFFGQDVLHRTYYPEPPDTSAEQLSRLSMEFRLTTRDCLLPNKDYFDLSQLNFTKAP